MVMKELHVVKKKKKKRNQSVLSGRLSVYLIVTLAGFTVFVFAKWKRGVYSQPTLVQFHNPSLDIYPVDFRLTASLRANNLAQSQAWQPQQAGNIEEEITTTKQLALPPIAKNPQSSPEGRKHVEFGPLCPRGEFKLPDMMSCHAWLDCESIYVDVDLGLYFEKGMTKKLQRGYWKGHDVAVQHPIAEKGKSRLSDFDDNIRHLILLQSPYVTQLIGFCNVSRGASQFERSYVVTQYYDKHDLGTYLQSGKYRTTNATTRLRLAASYLKVLLYLHTLPEGPRIVCDSNTLTETLRQYVVTSDLNVVLADLDDLPLVDKETGILAQCARQDILSEREDVDRSFLAPEQINSIITNYPESPLAVKFSGEKLFVRSSDGTSGEGIPSALDEKVDVYKIPNVTEAILLLSSSLRDEKREECLQLWNSLEGVHMRCKEQFPSRRPSVTEVLSVYIDVINSFS